MNQFLHAGDLGDIVACLPAIRACGGGELFVNYKPHGQRESLHGARFESIVPLLLAQDYITGVRWGAPNGNHIDFSQFRETPGHGMSLAHHQAQFAGVEISVEPWLRVMPFRHGRPVIARSARYHNDDFPWRDVLDRLKDPLFVGLPSEHRAFCVATGSSLEYEPSANLLELARVIAGCSVFVGNQSCPFWIAAGLGVRCVQESWLLGPNSTIHRAGMFYPMRMGYDIDACLR